MTPAQVRKIALALPEVEELDHWGNPSFRVNGRIFATMREAEKNVNLLKLSPEEHGMVEGQRGFELLPWGKTTYVQVDLRQVDRGLFEELLVTCWRRVAPKRALAAYDAAGGRRGRVDRRASPGRPPTRSARRLPAGNLGGRPGRMTR